MFHWPELGEGAGRIFVAIMTIIFGTIYLVAPVTTGFTDPNTVKKSHASPAQPSKGPTCDDFIVKMEQELAKMKQKRSLLASSKLSQADYEASMIESIKSLQSGLDGIRHTFVPISIPEYLRIPQSPPKWISLSPEALAKFKKIAEDNEFQQRELLVRFKRPSLRMASVEKTAAVLAERQRSVKDDNEWRQTTLVAQSFTLPMRMPITVPAKPSSSLVKKLENYIDSEDVNPPYDGDSAVLFLIDVFDDAGPLSGGYKSKCISEEVAAIAAALHQVAQAVPIDQCVGAVRPFVADLHADAVMQVMQDLVKDIQSSLEEAIELIDDVSMADFGSDGPPNVVVIEALKACKEFQGVERLAVKLQEAANCAVEAENKNKEEAAKQVAVAMIAAKLTWIPRHFALAVSWCSDSKYAEFTMQGVYVQAFDLVMNVVPDFNQ